MPVAAVAADTMHEDNERAGPAMVDRNTRRTGDIVSFPLRHCLAPFPRFGRYAPDCAAKSPAAASADQEALQRRAHCVRGLSGNCVIPNEK
jgi:hypothetical protein